MSVIVEAKSYFPSLSPKNQTPTKKRIRLVTTTLPSTHIPHTNVSSLALIKIGTDVIKSIILPFLTYRERCLVSLVCTHFNHTNHLTNIPTKYDIIYDKLYWDNHLHQELNNYYFGRLSLTDGKLIKLNNLNKLQMLKYLLIYQDFISSLKIISNVRNINLSNNVNIAIKTNTLKLQQHNNNPLPNRFSKYMFQCPKFPSIITVKSGDTSKHKGAACIPDTNVMIAQRLVVVKFIIDILRYKKYCINRKQALMTIKSLNLSKNYINDECLFNILQNGLGCRVIIDCCKDSYDYGILCNRKNFCNICKNNKINKKNQKNSNGDSELENNNNKMRDGVISTISPTNANISNRSNRSRQQQIWQEIGLPCLDISDGIKHSCFLLIQLNLSDNLITDECMVMLFNEIIPNKLPYLKQLNLATNDLSNKTCKVIYDYYKMYNKVSCLISIDLRNNVKIDINGIKWIDNIFKDNYVPNAIPTFMNSFKIVMTAVNRTETGTNSEDNADDVNQSNGYKWNKHIKFM